MSALFEQVKELVVENLNVEADKIKLESDLLKDLGADSLDVVEFTMALEEKFDIEIPDEAVENIKTVQDVINFIEKEQA